MKYALIGKGKTGSKVAEILKAQEIPFKIFDSENPVDASELSHYELGIVFVPGEVFQKILPTLVQSKIPIVSGSTGHTWPDRFDETLKKVGVTWIYSSNFAPGMSLIHKLLLDFNKVKKIVEDVDISIREVHHTGKLDAPSGTALAWSGRLSEHQVNIDSERVGDEVGYHELTLNLPYETITLAHKSLDRKVFANGAVEVANRISKFETGLINYEDYLQEQFNK